MGFSVSLSSVNFLCFWWPFVDVCVWWCTLLIKKMEGILEIFLFYFVSPFLTTLIWIGGRQELCKCLLFTSVKWYLDNTRPGEQDCVREYAGQTHLTILHSERWMSVLVVLSTMVIMVIWSVRRWSQSGYLLISVPVRTAILFSMMLALLTQRLIILLLKHPWTLRPCL